MKKLLLVASLALLVITGWFVRNRRFLFSREANVLANRIEPMDKWKEILLGEWNYLVVYQNENATDSSFGTINFRTDSTFIAYLTIKNFQGQPGYLHSVFRISGGSKTGVWMIADSSIRLWNSVCHLTTTYTTNTYDEFKPCKLYDSVRYGEYSGNYDKMKIIQFNKDTVRFNAHIFSSDADMIIGFSRPVIPKD